MTHSVYRQCRFITSLPDSVFVWYTLSMANNVAVRHIRAQMLVASWAVHDGVDPVRFALLREVKVPER